MADFDFNNLETWESHFTETLLRVVTNKTIQQLNNTKFRYVEDSLETLLDGAHRIDVIDAVLDLIRSNKVVGFHCSRLTEGEITNVQERGLVTLTGEQRKIRLRRALSRSPR